MMKRNNKERMFKLAILLALIIHWVYMNEGELSLFKFSKPMNLKNIIHYLVFIFHLEIVSRNYENVSYKDMVTSTNRFIHIYLLVVIESNNEL